MRTHIVMLSGPQGSGKSTLARALIEHHLRKKDNQAVELRFAKVIYDIHDSVLVIMRSYGINVPTKDGELLQLLGTEWGRKKYGDDVWVKATKKYIDACIEQNAEKNVGELLLIVSDCRFKNEFEALPEALRVRLIASEEVRRKRTDSWRENTNHPSETDLDEYERKKKFDLHLYTDTTDIPTCIDLVRAQLDKNSWAEKRR